VSDPQRGFSEGKGGMEKEHSSWNCAAVREGSEIPGVPGLCGRRQRGRFSTHNKGKKKGEDVRPTPNGKKASLSNTTEHTTLRTVLLGQKGEDGCT